MNLVFRWQCFGDIPWFVGACNLQQTMTPTCPQPATNHQPPAGGLLSLPSLPWLRKIRICHCYVMRSLYANISSCPELLGVQHATSPIWPSRYRKKTLGKVETWWVFSGRFKYKTEVHANQIEIKRRYIYIVYIVILIYPYYIYIYMYITTVATREWFIMVALQMFGCEKVSF